MEDSNKEILPSSIFDPPFSILVFSPFVPLRVPSWAIFFPWRLRVLAAHSLSRTAPTIPDDAFCPFSSFLICLFQELSCKK